MGANCGAVSCGGNACVCCSLEGTPTTGLFATVEGFVLVFYMRNSVCDMHHIFCTNTSLDQSSAFNRISRKPFSAPISVFMQPNLKVCLPNSSMACQRWCLLANFKSTSFCLSVSASALMWSSCALDPPGICYCTNGESINVSESVSASRPLHPQYAPCTAHELHRRNVLQAAGHHKRSQLRIGQPSLNNLLLLVQHPCLQVLRV